MPYSTTLLSTSAAARGRDRLPSFVRRLPALLAAAGLVAGLALPSVVAAACPGNAATAFLASPVVSAGPGVGFSAVLTDSQGIGLDICTDPTYCFFDPVVAGNAWSAQTGFGLEGFWFLAESNFATPELADVLVVMAAEATYASAVPADGQQFPFTRLRLRVDVSQPGIYTVEHPYGVKTYTVTAVTDNSGRPLRREINDTADIGLLANASNQGVVGPWLTWDATLPAPPAGFIGDGPNTLHTVTGSPCGTNFVRITAKALDGVTPLVLDSSKGASNPLRFEARSNLFTVQGRLVATTPTPLAIDQAYYSRVGDTIKLNVFASAPTTAALTLQSNLDTVAGPMASDGQGLFFSSVAPAAAGQVPATVTVTATHGSTSGPTTLTRAVTDLITITRADAVCSGPAGPCTLNVAASSSDPLPSNTLTLHLGGNEVVLPAGGQLSLSGLSVLPSKISVTSLAQGLASRDITINPQ